MKKVPKRIHFTHLLFHCMICQNWDLKTITFKKLKSKREMVYLQLSSLSFKCIWKKILRLWFSCGSFNFFQAKKTVKCFCRGPGASPRKYFKTPPHHWLGLRPGMVLRPGPVGAVAAAKFSRPAWGGALPVPITGRGVPWIEVRVLSGYRDLE